MIGPVAAAAFDVVDVWIGHAYSNPTTVFDHLIQSLLRCVTHHWNGSRNNNAIACLDEFDVEENLLSEGVAKGTKLLFRCRGGESALQVSVSRVCLHGPERGVVPRVVGKQWLRSQTGIWC